MIKTPYFGPKFYGIRLCVSRIYPVHDVVGARLQPVLGHSWAGLLAVLCAEQASLPLTASRFQEFPR